jgi:hypothetical protein
MGEFGDDWNYFFDCMLAPMVRRCSLKPADPYRVESALAS